MRYPMGAAVAVHEHESLERPSWFERVLVLGICAGLLVGVAILDDRAADRESLRAREVIAERAQRAAERSNREAMTAPAAMIAPRTERLGRDAPIVIAVSSSGAGTVLTEPSAATEQPSGTAGAVATSTSRTDDPLLLTLMAALGLSMAGGGLRLLSRRA